MLLLLQNRGRMTSVQLAQELETSPRTILRDVDAMTEAGLPIIVFQGNQGGIELGFNYRTRLTGLDRDEAESLGVAFGATNPALKELGMERAFERARNKLVESFPDKVRKTVQDGMAAFQVNHDESAADIRVEALANAIRERRIVRLAVNSDQPKEVHPVGLTFGSGGWALKDALSENELDQEDWGDINISSFRF